MLLYGITTLTEDINNKHCLTLVFVISVEHDNVELSCYVCCVLSIHYAALHTHTWVKQLILVHVPSATRLAFFLVFGA